jgi:hypothetical protein
LIAAHQGLQSVLTEDGISCATTDDAIATYSAFWMTAMLPEFVLSDGEGAAIHTISPATD